MDNKVLIFLILCTIILITAASASALEVIEKNEEQIFEIKLLENSSTGYIWNLDIENEDAAELIDVNKKSLKKDVRAAGVPDIKTWTFQTKDKGISVFKFTYHRMGSPDVIENEITYLIVVDIPVISLSNEAVHEISLIEMPEKGWKWHLESGEDFIRVLKTEYNEVEKDKELTDTSPLIKKWFITKSKTGYDILKFQLYQKWNKDRVKATKLFLVTAE